MASEIAPRSARGQWPPLWSPKIPTPRSVDDFAKTPLTKLKLSPAAAATSRVLQQGRDQDDARTIARLHRLVARQASLLDDRPRKMHLSGDSVAGHVARDFAASCLLSLAVWRRFGTADFAEALGWLTRTDYAAMVALLPDRAVEAAVEVWRAGRHAAGERTAAQRCARAVEERAWSLGCPAGSADAREAAAELCETELTRSLRRGGSAAAEAAKRDSVVAALLDHGTFESVREALRQVRGYGGLDADADREGWDLAFDLT
eukprot:CAMPEP_0115482974 /NCGR_PEP_ID=MMETSP0271-20121206/58613_1 /TAXON_ID=71861 /ORGANISM="Scrippsiella trochoidea, Strain CCMP3099" /LENGTH=260 /DNA_ID=CAMNT_0002910803 /DNA_START=79 /DNA_END=858 /DNA_ORIENTATION=+